MLLQGTPFQVPPAALTANHLEDDDDSGLQHRDWCDLQEANKAVALSTLGSKHMQRRRGRPPRSMTSSNPLCPAPCAASTLPAVVRDRGTPKQPSLATPTYVAIAWRGEGWAGQRSSGA